MKLVKFLSQFNASQLNSIYNKAIDQDVMLHGGTREDSILELAYQLETQYTSFRGSEDIKLAFAAINQIRPSSMTKEQHEEWISTVKAWAN